VLSELELRISRVLGKGMAIPPDPNQSLSKRIDIATTEEPWHRAETLSPAQVAKLMDVSYATVLRLIKRGLLRPLPGLRHKRITPGELRRYMNSAS